jgi:hypothetical protein
MNSEVVAWILEAARDSGIKVEQLSESDASLIVKEARRRFVKGNPRAWWLSLVGTITRRPSHGCSINELLGAYWGVGYLIPDAEDEVVVFVCSSSELEKIRESSPLFEYNYLNGLLTEMICENEHDEFICVRLEVENGCE